MLMSVVDELRYGAIYPELADARVMITGLTPEFGTDIAREFADHRARLVLQSDKVTPKIDEITAILTHSAVDVRLFGDVCNDADNAVRFAQTTAQQAFGGLDVVVNLIEFSHQDLLGLQDLADVEDLVTRKLLGPTLLSRVVANRMRLSWTNGLILNVVRSPDNCDARQTTVLSLIGATLAAMTRREAETWADQAIRINAIGPDASPVEADRVSGPVNEADIAALAGYLASDKGKALSGLVFDAAGLAGRIC